MNRRALYAQALGVPVVTVSQLRRRARILYWDTRFRLGYRIGGFTSARRAK